MLFVFKDVGQVEDAVERLKCFEFGGVAFRQRQAAALYEFDGFALCAELGVGVDADFDFAVGVFLHFVGEGFHRFVNGDFFALVVAQFEGDGSLRAEGKRGDGCGEQGFFEVLHVILR